MKIRAEDLPPSHIRIDKEGGWHYKGSEMFRKDIVKLFYENLKRDDEGRYYIELENDIASLEVEDTAYVVKAVYRLGKPEEGNERIVVLLSDETLEEIDCSTLSISRDNVLYCSVKPEGHPARFLRSSYYQIADAFEYDESRDAYYLPLNGKRYYIQQRDGA
ncbi:MAG: DUF1285 domain-containing protein [Syntrophaceae bacterium]|nr:DUF1285 domain-containing protein [Syntrophaceae bacterium]